MPSLLDRCPGGLLTEPVKPVERPLDPDAEQALRDKILEACLPAQPPQQTSNESKVSLGGFLGPLGGFMGALLGPLGSMWGSRGVPMPKKDEK